MSEIFTLKFNWSPHIEVQLQFLELTEVHLQCKSLKKNPISDLDKNPVFILENKSNIQFEYFFCVPSYISRFHHS